MSDAKNTYTQNMNTANQAILMEQRKVAIQAAPTLEKCVAITKSMGTGRANAVQKFHERVITKNLDSARNAYGNANLDSITKSVSTLGTCKESDVKDGICTSVGKYAGADEDMDSLRYNKLGGNNSIDPEQAKVAQQAIKNSVYGFAPSRLEGNRAANSESYQAHKKVWNTRVSPFANTLKRQLSWNTSINIGDGAMGQSSLAQSWNSEKMKSAYEQINQVPQPANPSMNELITATVSRDMFYANDAAETTALSEQELLVKLNEKMAINNFLLLMTYNSLADMNQSLSSIGMQMYAPVSNDFGQTAQAGY